MKERIYELHKVNEIEYSHGTFRKGELTDLDKVLPWAAEFMKEAVSEEPTEEELEKYVRSKILSETLNIWEDGQPVSIAASTRPAGKSISINLVFTPRPFRRRGYARSCVARLTEKLLNDGYQYCTIYTDLSNPTSNKIYQEIGYREVGDLYEIDFLENSRSRNDS